MGNGTEGTEEGTPAPRNPHGVPTDQELHSRFFYRPPRDSEAVRRHEEVSTLCYSLAHELCQLCYPGRQLSLALTALEEVRMRANASIACDDPRP
jgi:hypothetical protein